MAAHELHVVTGAFGFSGNYIARRLLTQGHRVRTLTNSPERIDRLSARIEVHPYNFDRPVQLFDSLRGARVLYNTYWPRLDEPHYSIARENSLRLLETAQRAGVERVVHLSVTNPAANAALGYYRAKSKVEEALRRSGMSYGILRPALLYGVDDFLVNTIAWLLRRAPVFLIFGDGYYKIQPIYVEDLAVLAVELGATSERITLDAVGPVTYTYRELVKTIGKAIGHPRPLLSVPPALGVASARLLGQLLGDTLTTGQEVRGLMENRLVSTSLPLGWTRLDSWLRLHQKTVGQRYASTGVRRRKPPITAGELRSSRHAVRCAAGDCAEAITMSGGGRCGKIAAQANAAGRR